MATIVNRKKLERQIAPSFTPDQTEVLVDVFDNYNALEVERASDTREIKEDLQALTEQQQALTEQQQVLAEKVDKLADAVLSLAEAQARTDLQLHALTEAQASLAEAQARTEARMERGFAEVWGAISKLTTQMSGLTDAVSQLGKQVGSMVNTFGHDLEDFTGALLPPYLEQHFGVAGLSLERSYFSAAEGATEEIDLYGRGVRGGVAVAVFVEVKTTLGGTEARRLADKLDQVAADSGVAQVLKLIVAMNIHPTAVEAVRGRDLELLPYSRIRL